jgi:hypothetical protein
MPYVNGRQVAAAVKTASPSTPVILITGWGEQLTADGDSPSQVDHIMGKPPKLNELRAVLARFGLGRQASQPLQPTPQRAGIGA